jgi:hypothetical protein
VMLVTKRAKFLARPRSRHRSSFKTHLQTLHPETACQWSTPAPFHFEFVPQNPIRVFIRQRSSGVKSVFNVKSPRLGGLEVVDGKHL